VTVHFTPLAAEDLDKILAGLTSKSANAARGLAAALSVQLQLCDRLPRAYPQSREPRVRRCPLTSYPYTIYFRERSGSDGIEVLMVIHSARVKTLTQMPERD